MVYEYNDLRVELDSIGEGLCGDYNSNDSNDTPLLRFWAYRRNGECWEEIEDSSYCTCIPADVPMAVMEEALCYIHREFADAIRKNDSVKKLGERLSYLSDADFT